nr:2-hydroxyacyl-CoA dehydratase family protein [Desulfurobacterium thermolithotrophum]
MEDVGQIKTRVEAFIESVEVQIEGGHPKITFESQKEVSTDETIEKIQRNIPPYIKHKYSIQRNPERRKKSKKET